MNRFLVVPACCIGLLIAAAPASAHYQPRGKACGAIGGTPQTDEGVSDIRAKNATCRLARRVARAYMNGDRSPRDFSCSRREHDGPGLLAHNDVLCKRGDKRVTFAHY